ncbi:mechanosensitive ion channel family protein [Lederbergia lenta]|nr:mechanosensitive ion channel domain-containing protein [Lederbergia lenta]MCM3109660.1 mechanosensitive ion channel family protein [Lederbergia lenta]MEC2324589.1 mechanosensitive ion channel [Lederbergia lenta]
MDLISKWLLKFELNANLVKYLSIFIMILFIAFVCIVANFITKKVVIRIITHIVRKNNFQWGNIIVERKVFRKLSHVVPAIIIFQFASTFTTFEYLIQKGATIYIILTGLMVFNSLLDAINDIYQTHDISKIKPIKGYLQVVKIIVITFGIIFVIAILMDESPLILLSGIGALSAVFMLIFKDSLLGLVAGVQLSNNDMVRVGDWIEIPKYGADGDVIDISLNTVKVQNFDKTITMVPSYALISDSFKNWRGMQTSGGRRIKRSLFIDTNSISFCTEEMIERFNSIDYLTDYITKKEREIEEYNIQHEINRSITVNGRALTNIGVFREYIRNYLKNHSGINQDMSLMVRQLAPSENGLPIEIYAFSNDIRWAVYESIQGDIFDHLFAVAPQFGLRLFQNPTGHDLKTLMSESNENIPLKEREQ